MDVLTATPELADDEVTGSMWIDATASLVFQLDPKTGAGYVIELWAGSWPVTLQKLPLMEDRWTGQQRFAHTDYQRVELGEPLDRGTALPFRLILSGPYIELTLGDEVVIATLSGELVRGRFGFWVTEGTGSLEDVMATPLKPVPIRARSIAGTTSSNC